MRIFKPTYIVDGKPKAGPRWHVGFTDHLEIRHSLAATTDKTASEQFGRNIEQLVAVAKGGARPDGDLAKWIEGLAPKLGEPDRAVSRRTLRGRRRSSAGPRETA